MLNQWPSLTTLILLFFFFIFFSEGWIYLLCYFRFLYTSAMDKSIARCRLLHFSEFLLSNSDSKWFWWFCPSITAAIITYLSCQFLFRLAFFLKTLQLLDTICRVGSIVIFSTVIFLVDGFDDDLKSNCLLGENPHFRLSE